MPSLVTTPGGRFSILTLVPYYQFRKGKADLSLIDRKDDLRLV